MFILFVKGADVLAFILVMPTGPFTLDALNYGQNPPDYRLSDARLSFVLTDLTDSITIDEPVGFDALEWVLERDPEWHGFNFEFTSADTPLTFVDPLATDYIESRWRKNGPNANIFLHWIMTLGSQTIVMQRLRLMMHKRKRTGNELTIPAERHSLYPDLRAGWDVPYALDSVSPAVTTGVASVTPPAPVSVAMHAQEIVARAETTLGAIADTGWFSILNADVDYRVFYLTFPINNFKPSEIILSQTKASGTENGVSTEPVYPTRPVLTPRDGGKCHIDLQIDATFDLRLQLRRINIVAPEIRNYSIRLYLESQGERQPISTAITGTVASRFLEGIHLTGSFSGDIFIAPETGIYVYAEVSINPNRGSWKGTDLRLRTNSLSFKAEARTTAPQSLATGYLPLPALNALTALVTGRTNAVRSAYYGKAGADYPTDGPGANRVLVSGFALRAFKDQLAPVLSFKTLLSGLSAIDAVGMGISPGVSLIGDPAAQDTVVVEPISHFYVDTEIMQLADYSIIEEEVEEERIPGLVTVGYSDYPNEGALALNEFCTQQQYQMPTRTGKPIVLTSELIASGLLIEQTRREQFAEKPSDSTSYDEKVFIVDSKPYLEAGGSTEPLAFLIFGTTGVFYNRECLKTEIAIPKTLTVGMRVNLASYTQDLGNYTLTKIEFDPGTATTIDPATGSPLPNTPPSWRLYFAETLAAYETSLFAVTVLAAPGGGGYYVPVRDEDYETVQGIPAPETTYNLDLSPRMNLLRWGRYLAGGLSFNSGSDEVRVQKTSGAKALITRKNGSTETIAHASNTFVARLRNPFPLWRPERVTVETELTYDQVLYLRSCMQGFYHDSALHYGYISLTDSLGVKLRGFLLRLSYKPATRRATLVLLKKRVSLNELSSQRGCEYYQSYRFDFFESGTTVDNWIEQCQFDNFQ